jgi:hypothetical protein
MVVTEVDPDGVASEHGLLRGMIEQLKYSKGFVTLI